MEKTLSIMDYYHLEEDGRRISQYALLHRESSLGSEAGERLSVSVSRNDNVDFCHPD